MLLITDLPMAQDPRYLFLKQAAKLHSYFGDLCLDLCGSRDHGVVYSEIEDGKIGNVEFRSGPKYDRGSFRKRAVSWGAYFLRAAQFAFRVKGKPLLFIIAQPPFLPLLGYLQKKMLGRHYVVWIDDVYPDVLVRRGVVQADGLIDRLWSAFNRIVFRNADQVFTLGPYMAEVVSQYLPSSMTATIVATSVDTEFVRPVPKFGNTFAERYGLVNKISVMYSGNVGETHEVQSLLKAAQKLSSRSDIHFMIIGGGAQWEAMVSMVGEQQATNITLLPWQPASVLPYSLASADIAFVSLDKGTEGISMPSKTYYAMAAGSAILASCTGNSDLADVVTRSNCGVVVEPGNVDEVVRAIEVLSENPEYLLSLKQNSRTAAVERYSRFVTVEKVRNAIGCIQGEN